MTSFKRGYISFRNPLPKTHLSLPQPPTGVPRCFSNSALRQPTPSREGAHPRSPVLHQPLTGIRSTASAVSSRLRPNGLHRRSKLWCCASCPLQTSPCASCTAARDTQVKSYTHKTHTHTYTHSDAFVHGFDIGGCYWDN